MQCTMVMAALNAFENGLNIGLSLLWNILNAETSNINIVHLAPDRTERRCEPLQQQSDIDNIFISYIKKVCPYLDSEQKAVIQSGIEKILNDNMEKQHSIS